MWNHLLVIEVTSLWEVEAADVGVFGDAVHCEFLPPSTQVDPLPSLLQELIWLWEGKEGNPWLWVSWVRRAHAPAAVLWHIGICKVLIPKFKICVINYATFTLFLCKLLVLFGDSCLCLLEDLKFFYHNKPLSLLLYISCLLLTLENLYWGSTFKTIKT